MKKCILLLMIAASTCVWGNTSDSLKLTTFQRAIANDSMKIGSLQKEVIALKSAISKLKQEDAKLQFLYEKQTVEFDNLKDAQIRQEANVKVLADKLGADIVSTEKKMQENSQTLSATIHNRTLLAASGILLAIVLLVVIYLILRKRIDSGASTIDKIRSAQEGLAKAQKAMQEESVKLDSKLVELLEKQVTVQPQDKGGSEPDHSLALKVADEIVRIETNLSRMDESVKGYKQLSKAVEHIRNNFLANGYEIVEMLGKPYNEGMKVVANFVTDDSLAEGEQKITGIIKPQINYNGKMIQSAQITVSQNL